MRTSKKAVSITLLAVMIISTFATLGINPVWAQTQPQNATTKIPYVYYVDGHPYVPQDILKNAYQH